MEATGRCILDGRSYAVDVEVGMLYYLGGTAQVCSCGCHVIECVSQYVLFVSNEFEEGIVYVICDLMPQYPD